MSKVVKIEKYKEVYKCQRCGETIYGEERTRSQLDGRTAFRMHGCLNGDFGIGMLVGFEKVKNAAT